MSTDHTAHFGFSYQGRNDSRADENFKSGTRDVDLNDLLHYLAMVHKHDGASTSSNAPTSGLSLELDQTQGSLKSGKRIFYKHTLVDATGVESAAGPEAFIDTPAAIAAPSAPTSATSPTGGTLLPGPYSYVLSAYKDATTLETTTLTPASVQLGASSTTWEVTLTLPALPAGADGFNVYRRKPGESQYHYLDSVDMGVATPPTTWIDTGALAEDCDRGLPQANTTNAQNAIIITFPGATPVVPAGYTWKIYRTLISGTYENSLLHHVVEETSEGSGIITTTFTDLGLQTSTGTPPASEFGWTNPDPVELADGAEIQGVLPPSHVTYMFEKTWVFPGTLEVKDGEFPWRFPYDAGLIRWVVTNLGKNSVNSGDDVVVDVNKYDAQIATPAWASIFDDDPDLMPHIVDGDDESPETVPLTVTLFKGDRLVPDLIQVGGAATPTDENLVITVIGWAADLTDTTVQFG